MPTPSLFPMFLKAAAGGGGATVQLAEFLEAVAVSDIPVAEAVENVAASIQTGTSEAVAVEEPETVNQSGGQISETS